MFDPTKMREDVERLIGGIGVEPFVEELEIDRNCATRWYRWARREINNYLKLSSLKLRQEPLEEFRGVGISSRRRIEVEPKMVVMSEIQLENSVSEPPEVLAKLGFFWRWSMSRPLCFCILTYLLVKFALISFLVYRRDSSAKHWKPKLRPDAIRNGQCTLANESHVEEPTMEQIMKTSSEWLDHSGNLFGALVGAPILLFQFTATFIVFLYFLGFIIIPRYGPRCDYLNFALNPHCERKRIRMELDKIVLDLMSCLSGHAAISNISSVQDQNSIKHTARCSNQVEVQNFLKLLNRSVDLVRPSNLTSKWHKNLLYLCNGFTVLFVSAQTCVFGAAGMGLVLECSMRAVYRLNVLKCRKWMTNGVLIKQTVRLDELQDQLDLNAYAQHDGSLFSLVKLGLTIESKFLVKSPMNCVFCIEIVIFMLYTCIVFPTHQCCYWWGVFDKLKWLRQVEEQLVCCVQLCANQVERNNWAAAVMEDEKETEFEDEEEEEQHMVKFLVISYLNYRLFYSQQSAFMSTTKTFISPMVFGGIYMMLLSYIVSTQTESVVSRFALIGLLYFLFQSNFYLFTGALFLSKSQKMMRNISRLLVLAKGGGGSNRRIIVDLWRRQLLTITHLTKLFGFTIFGGYLTYDLLIEVNFYLILIFVITFRSENGFNIN